MLIESKIKRAGGSKIDIAGVVYHFKPVDPKDNDSPHVCDVPDDHEAAIARFLSITEGFRMYRPGAKAEPENPVAPVRAPAPPPEAKKPRIELPDFGAMKGKKEVLAWAQANMPELQLSVKLPEGAIIKRIREHAGYQ